MFKMSGTVDRVQPVEQISQNFSKRDLVLFIPNQQNPNYPNHISFQATNKKISLLDNVQPGSTVEIGFFVNGRQVTMQDGKVVVFNSLNIAEINVLGQQNNQQAPQQGYNPQQNQPQQGYNPQQNQPQQGYNPQQNPPQQQPQQGYNPQQNPPQQAPQQGYNPQGGQPQQGFNPQQGQPQQGQGFQNPPQQTNDDLPF